MVLKFIKSFFSDESGIFPVLGLAIAALATGAQVASSVISQDAARDAERARRGADELEAQRTRLQAVREARIRRAEVAAAAEAQGASDSSGATGALGSIGTQLASNLGFVTSQSQTNRIISRQQLRSNTAGLIGDVGSGISSIGGSLANFRDRQAQAKAIEDKNAATRVPLNG